MQLTIYHSDKGDCSLVTAKDGARILADGGMAVSYNESVAPELTKLLSDTKNKKLDVVYVSHIDDDHIGGILKMLDDLMAWRVHDHHKKIGNTAVKAPTVPRPPDIDQIWHNGFSDMLADNAGPIASQLSQSAAVLSGFTASNHADSELGRAVAKHQDLAESVPQAIKLSRRIADGQLGIALNKSAGGLMMMRRANAKPIKVGSLRVHTLAPSEADLKELRDDWNKWLKADKTVLAAINAKSKQDSAGLISSGVALMEPMLAESVRAAEALSDALNKELNKTLGDRKPITSPNLASLMLLVKEGKKTILLTGDGHADDVTKGLDALKLLPKKGLHVDILKVPHHGATDNMTDDFATKVTADHYVFCGNGFASNPELAVIKRLADARLDTAKKATTAAALTGSFTFWFNCSSAVKNTTDQTAHMKKVEKFVAGLVKGSGGRMKANFMGPKEVAQVIQL